MLNQPTGYPSIDKPWIRYYSDDEWNRLVPKQTIWKTVYENNKDWPNSIALNYYGRKITYSKLFQEIERCQYTLTEHNIRKGDNVSALLVTTPEMLYLLFALNKIGACVNFINPLFTEEQICKLVDDSNSKMLVVMDVMYEKIAKISDRLPVCTIVVVPIANSMPFVKKTILSLKSGNKRDYDKRSVMYPDWITKDDVCKLDDDYEQNQSAVMVYSSGSTGTSKGIVLTNDGINATLSYYDKAEYRLKRGSNFLCMGSPWFSTGIVFATLMPLNKGITVDIYLQFSELDFLKMIRGCNGSATLATPSHWIYAAKHGNDKKLNLSEMICPVSGGEKILPETEQLVNDFLISHGAQSGLLIGYGMCELGSAVSTNSIEHRKTGSVGFPIKGVTVAAFDVETNQECKYNERGEIRVLSPARMKGYYNNQEATAEFFWKDHEGREWGRTGDIGYVDEDGFIYILGRANDTINITPDKDIYCFDIENTILDNSNVYQCEVVGVQGAYGNEIPYAFIVLTDNCNMDSQEVINKLKELCAERLEEKCRPVKYKILDKFPVKQSGKRDMEALRRLAENR